MTASVASNGLNTLVVPTVSLIPQPEIVGAEEQLPSDNPSVTIELPDKPESRVSIGLDGQGLGPSQHALHDRVLFFAVPPLKTEVVHGRISYVVDGALKLLRFQLRRAETVDELMDSLQAQFDNMTDLVERFADAIADKDRRAFAFERTRLLQTTLINAMEPLPWSPEDYDTFLARSAELDYTAQS